tara:strand:- start:2141 stop:2257 length:117 start_codon:yes stop_codon:yes gene_type:complete
MLQRKIKPFTLPTPKKRALKSALMIIASLLISTALKPG